MTLPNWFEFDVKIKKSYRETLLNLFKQIDRLKEDNLISNWFFLYEGAVVRIRFKCEIDDIPKIKKIFLKRIFENYYEEDYKFKSELELDAFASIMNITSEFVKNSIEKDIWFDKFNFLERTYHCIHNITRGDKGEVKHLIAMLFKGLANGYNFQQTIYE